MSYLELTGLQKRYGNAVAVDDVSLSVEQGESVALLGPSGCGKTTTLRMLAGLVAPDRGVISLGGGTITRLPPHKRNMGYVFQSYALFPHLSVARNIAFGLEERGVARQEIARRGVVAAKPIYAAQIALYQAYLGLADAPAPAAQSRSSATRKPLSG